MSHVISFLHQFIDILAEMSPYLLFGFLVAGILYVAFPREKVVRYLGGNSLGSVINAALLGVPLPLCSCGVIPTGISLHKNGASKGATVSFLISTPQTGVDSIFVTWSLLGLPFALIRPVIAFITGIFGGILAQRVGEKDVAESAPEPSRPDVPKQPYRNTIGTVFKYAFVDFLDDIAGWLVIGVLVAALITVTIPDSFFSEVLPGMWAGMLLMLVISIPWYVCATASVPIAAALMMKGISPGAALVFLMAGPATNAATMMVVGKVMGKKTLFVYLAAIIGGALFFGWIIDTFLPVSWFSLPGMSKDAVHTHAMLPSWAGYGSAVILGLLIINVYIRRWLKKTASPVCDGISCACRHTEKVEETMNLIMRITGMTCQHCRANVENALRNVSGVETVDIDLGSGTAKITGTALDRTKLVEAVRSVGYEVKE